MTARVLERNTYLYNIIGPTWPERNVSVTSTGSTLTILHTVGGRFAYNNFNELSVTYKKTDNVN
ncbi:unnamed protein product [Clavelina lepadiformis]|uniref:Uncharacterized protein n=1 Tax=Clavelina lepadiformis TaxID=159417 RepID=A0ABP0G8N6_CLALP